MLLDETDVNRTGYPTEPGRETARVCDSFRLRVLAYAPDKGPNALRDPERLSNLNILIDRPNQSGNLRRVESRDAFQQRHISFRIGPTPRRYQSLNN